MALVDLRSLMGSRNVVETRWGNGGMEGRGEEGVESRWRGGEGERGRDGRGGTVGGGQGLEKMWDVELSWTAYPGLPHLLLSLLHPL